MKQITFSHNEYDDHREWIKTINWHSVEFDYETNTITIKYRE